MAWHQLRLTTDKDTATNIAPWLELAGAVSVTFSDAKDTPILEPKLGTTPLWDEVELLALFETCIDKEHITNVVQERLPSGGEHSFVIEYLDDEDWTRKWMDDFKPMRFGERLWICPSCFDPVDEPGAVNLILDPGLAFGTGTHPTTALCLEWLEQQVKTDDRLIDFGCGSGVLALAALKLGADFVYAVDHDPQALTATIDNAERNQIAAAHYLACQANELNNVQADYLIANIVASPLMELAPLFSNLVTSGAAIALAGILEEQAEQVIAQYSRYGFELKSNKQQDEWVLLVGHKR